MKGIGRAALFTVVLLSSQGVFADELINPQRLERQSWYRATTPNFTVITDSGKKRAVKLAQNLERFRAMFEIVHGLKIDETIRPVKLIATQRDRTYRILHGDSESMRNTGGFFIDSINGNYSALRVYRGNRYEDWNLQVLFHEYTHYLVANMTTGINPLWFNEGLAEYMALTEFKDDSTIDYGKVSEQHLINMSNMSWMPVEELLTTTNFSQKYATRRYKVYSQGWLLTHFIKSQERVEQGQLFVKLLREGVAPAEATERALGMSLKQLDRALKKYKGGRKMYFSRITLASPLSTDDIRIEKLRPAEQLYELGEFILQTMAEMELARPLFEHALKLEPNYANALAGLANTYFGSDEPLARELIGKAKAADKENPWVATISGHLNFRMYTQAGAEEQPALRTATVRDYNKAINLGGPNLEALLSAANLYLYEQRHDKALELLSHAWQYAANNHNLRLSLIQAYLGTGKLEQAEAISQLVRQNYHWSEETMQSFEEWYAKAVAAVLIN